MTRASLDFSGFIPSRTKDFTGREWVFFAINRWLADEGGKRIFLLTGEPGCGKSALAACLVQISQDKLSAPANCPALKPNFLSAFHFCSASKQTWINPHTFTTSLALQLADHYPVYAQALAELNKDERIHIEVHQTAQQIRDQGKQIGVYIENLDVSRISAEDAFVRTVCEPLTVLATEQPNQPIVILVDALDEALVYTGQRTIVDLLARTQELPANVRFLLTSRQEPRVENEFSDAAGLFVSADKNRDQNNRDIYQYITAQFREVPNLQTLQAQLQPDELRKAINTIVDKADGNFRYITFLLTEMANGQRQLTDLQGLPADLDGLYYQSLERLVQQGKRNWSDDYAPICGILSVAQDALTLSQLVMLTKQPEETLWSHLADLQQFVEDVPPAVGTDVDVVYRLYHQSVADFLHRRYIRREGEQSKNKYYLTAESWHRQIANYYWNTYHDDWQQCDLYGLRNLVSHQIACLSFLKNPADKQMQAKTIYNVVLDPAFRKAQHNKSGDGNISLNDLRHALELALARDDIVPVLRCVFAYREVLRGANLIQDFFESVDEQAFETAQKRLNLYLGIPEWGAVAHLYLAWEAAEVGNEQAVTMAVKAAQRLPLVNVKELCDALLVRTTQALLRSNKSKLTISAYLQQWGVEVNNRWLETASNGVAPSAVTDEELSFLCKQLESLTEEHRSPRESTNEVESILTKIVTHEVGLSCLDRLLQKTLANKYPPYRDIELVPFGIACIGVCDPNWLRTRLRKILSITLDREGLSFTFDLPAMLVGEARARGWEATTLATHLHGGLATEDHWGSDERASLAWAGALFRHGQPQEALNAMTQKERPSQVSAGYATLTVLAMIDRCLEMGRANLAIDRIWPNSDRSLIQEAKLQARTVLDSLFQEQRRALVAHYQEWLQQSLPDITQLPTALNAFQDNDTRMAYINHLAARWAGTQEGPNLPALKALIAPSLNDRTTLDATLARFIGLNLSHLTDDDLNELIQLVGQSINMD